MSVVGKLTADFIAIIKFGSQESHLQANNPRHSRSHVRNKQDNNHSSSASLRTDQRTSFGGLVVTLDIVIKVILICFICLSMWVNIMMLALKPGHQIAVKTGNPAGLLFRQIWYSV